MPAVPPGFELIEPYGQFHEMCGPMYVRKTDAGCIIGLRMEEKHGNRGRNLHGGMVAMLIDSAFTHSHRILRNPPKPGVTVNLSVDMMSTARPGDWLEVHVEAGRIGRTTTFLSCYVLNDGQRIARGSGVFQVVERPPEPAASSD